jgi:non-canonical purine NTP pyrophosphatase (RdgB/HAM1 family)
MAIQFITGNKTKVKEFNATLDPFSVEQVDIDLAEIQSLDTRKIIEHKLREAFNFKNGEFLVEDSSLTMDALGGKLPGPLIKWFNETIGTKGLADIADKFEIKGAKAITIIGYAKTPEDIRYFEGVVEGQIVQPRGDYQFGYDPIFVPKGQVLTLSEMKSQGIFSFSPRGLAVQKLKDFLCAKI